MTRQQLRIELKWFCGCGDASAAAAALHDILSEHEAPSVDRPKTDQLLPVFGARMLVLYHLDDRGYTEHGGSVTGGWLTKKGEDVLNALEVERRADDYAALSGTWCVHGFDYGIDCPSCSELNP